MSQEIQKTEEATQLSMVNDLFSVSTEADKKEMADAAPPKNWLDSLGVCYSLSKACKQGIGRPGNFLLGGKVDLGSSVKALAIAYRIRASVIRNNDEIVSSTYHLQNDPRRLIDDEDFQRYLQQSLGRGEKLLSGTELLMYMPERQVFVSMWFKNTLAPFADDIYQKSKPGGRVVSLTTAEVEKKGRTWYDIHTVQTSQTVVGSPLDFPGVQKTLALPFELLERSLKIFTNPPLEASEESDR